MKRLILAFLLCMLWTTPSHAVRVLTTGLEENYIGAYFTTSGTAPTIDTSIKHSGSYSEKTTAAAASSVFRFTKVSSIGTGVTIYTKFNMYVDDATPSANTAAYVSRNSSTVASLQFLVKTTGVFNITNNTTSTAVDSTATLSNATWYRVEVSQLLSDTVGTMTVSLYTDATPSVLVETITLPAPEDTMPTDIQVFDFGKSASTSTFYIDDIVINTSAGAAPTTAPGPGKIYMLVPNSNVSLKFEDSAGGTDNATFSNIDDQPGTPDDATTYNASDTLLDIADAIGDIDRFGLTDMGAEVPSDAAMLSASVYARVGSNQTSATGMRLKLWDESATLTNGPSLAANVNGFRNATDSQYLFLDLSGKTKLNLDSFDAGYEVFTDTITLRPRRVTTLWVNIEWTESTGSIQQGGLGGALPAVIK